MKLLLYCVKAKPYLYKTDDTMIEKQFGDYHTQLNKAVLNDNCLNGKIVAECDYEVEEILYLPNPSEFDRANFLPNEWCYDYIGRYGTSNKSLLKRSCLTTEQLSDYLNTKSNDKKTFGKDTFGYAIHIKNLHIFEEPKELNEIYKIEDIGGMLFTKPLTNAPQNMMRVSINHWDYATYEPNDINVLISIQPQWLCKILKGEKTIEVRKIVLKVMLEGELRYKVISYE